MEIRFTEYIPISCHHLDCPLCCDHFHYHYIDLFSSVKTTVTVT